MDQFCGGRQKSPTHSEALQNKAVGFPYGDLRHLNHQTAITQTSTRYEDLISSFAGLSVSSNSRPSYPYSAFDDNTMFMSAPSPQNMGYGGRGFWPVKMSDMEKRMVLSGIGTHVPNDYVHVLAGSDVLSYPNPTPYSNNQSFNDGNVLPPRSRETPIRECSQGLFKNNNKSLRYSSHNRSRPAHWLQEPTNYLSVTDLKGKIATLAKDQNRCTVLHNAMKGITDQEIHILYSEVIDNVGELMVDPIGNYVVQKLIELCSEEQRTRILRNISRHEFQLTTICLGSHGTRAVQTLLKHMNTQEQISTFMEALTPGAAFLCKHTNSHHVVNFCLKNFSVEANKYFLHVVAANCFHIATDKIGCCVLQTCVDYSFGATRDNLVTSIASNALELAQDPFGNYVVQHILELKVPHFTASLLAQLQGNFTALSFNKYGSNVVEKCLGDTTDEQSIQIIVEILQNDLVHMLLVDAYGNYVIQASLARSKDLGPVHFALVHLIEVNARTLKTHMYGKKGQMLLGASLMVDVEFVALLTCCSL
ncbi:hypothetical protein K2173_007870 [Erythroxylum novogranatense]|uniref:PUM-HD domain-containing protein n=1 Tax=Erythroxylum novogranatense TaxID=1862640 RepID=A0AAV8T6L9_9ROSI|nr:hypothetical protein K2173_007870 [Erythroxylum novogranatense]